MKKITLVTIIALSLTSVAAMPAHGSDAGFHSAHEAGVKVYRGSAATQINHQAVASYRKLELQERKINNQNQLARAQLNSQNSIAQQRLDLDRRIAFTNNEIFSQRNNRFGGRGFNTRRGFNSRRSSRGFNGGNNRGFNGAISNRFLGVNGISQNSNFSGGFSGGTGTRAVRSDRSNY